MEWQWHLPSVDRECEPAKRPSRLIFRLRCGLVGAHGNMSGGRIILLEWGT